MAPFPSVPKSRANKTPNNSPLAHRAVTSCSSLQRCQRVPTVGFTTRLGISGFNNLRRRKRYVSFSQSRFGMFVV